MTQQRIRTISKVALNKLASGYRSSNALNNDLDIIEEAFDNTLSRDGSGPNQMEAVLDMNSNRIINLDAPENPNDALRLQDLQDFGVQAVLDVVGETIEQVAIDAGTAAAREVTNTKLDRDGLNAETSLVNNLIFSAVGEDNYPYSLGDRLREVRSVMEYIPTILHASIKAGTAIIPVHEFLNNALSDPSAPILYAPPGYYPISRDVYLHQTVPGQIFFGAGDETIIARIGDTPTACRPVLISTAPECIVRQMQIRHNATADLTPTTVINNIAFASAVILMGDYSRAEDLSVYDAWDNGVSVGKFDLTTGIQVNGSPIAAKVSDCFTYNAGCGIRLPDGTYPLHQAGAGVNNLTGQGIVIENCVDWMSRTGFVNDYGSGATSIFDACISYYPKKSRLPGDTFPTEFSRYGGFGFYVAGRSQLINCEVYDAESDGLWLDGFSHNCTVTNFRAKGCKQRHSRIQGRDHMIKNLVSEDNSYMNTGLYPAVLIEGTSDGADGTPHSRNIMVDGIITTGPYHTYGLQVIAGGDADRKVHGFAANLQLNGTLGQVDNPNYASFALRGFATSVPGASQYTLANSISDYDGTIRIRGEGTNAATNHWGAAAGRGQLWLLERRDTNKRLVLGMDGDRAVGVVQAIENGVAARTLDLNPNPAETRTWNKSDAGQMGEAYDPAVSANLTGTSKRVFMGYEGPNERGVIQASEEGVTARKLVLNPYSGDIELGDGTVAAVWVSIPSIGLRKLELGATNSGGTGYRMVRVLN